MNARTTFVAALVAVVALLSTPAPTHADDEPPTVVWTATTTAPVESGASVSVRVARSEPGPEVDVAITVNNRLVTWIVVAEGKSGYSAPVRMPAVATTRKVTVEAHFPDHTTAALSVTVLGEPPRPVGRFGHRESPVLSARYLYEGARRWSPCEPVTLVVRHPDLVAATQRAARILTRATGIPVRASRTADTARFVRVTPFDFPGQMAGRGGATRLAAGSTPGSWVPVRGQARIDLAQTRRPAFRNAVVLHELAHVFGVGHSDHNGSDAMSPWNATQRLSDWDRAALRYAGQGAC